MSFLLKEVEITMLEVITLNGPVEAIVKDIVQFTATVKNIGSVDAATNVTFWENNSGTVISIQGTSLIPVGGTQNVSISINTTGWGIGTYNICAKTSDEV